MNDLTKEGTITFEILIKNNPQFKNPDSNINFMYNKNVGGVLLTFLKEKENLKVEIENPSYGKLRLINNISTLLDKGIMVVSLTWKESSVKLYLNGELVEEGILKKGKGLIKIVLEPETDKLAQEIHISYDEVNKTINDRHRGILIPGNPMRIGATHWFEDKIVFLMAYISKSRVIGNTLKFEEVKTNLILKLYEKLPVGNITKNMHFDEILNNVAKSFGVPVTTIKNGEPKLLHIESEWDNKTVEFKSKNNETVLIQGTFSPNEKKCYYVWAFSLNKYRDWIQSHSDNC